jgi:hypothetical protein
MNFEKIKKIFSLIFGFGLIGLLCFSIYQFVSFAWSQFISLDKQLAVGLLTAFTTVVVATITVMLGRYLERKKEIESHFRTRKIEIYDEFLSEFFKLFGSEENSDIDLTPFLREWQRKMIIWGGSPVLSAYIKWNQHLKKGNPDAQTIFLMDDFFRAMRKDVGLNNNGLEKGVFAHFILRNSDLFLSLAKSNPSITLDDLAKIEKELGK